MLPQPAAPPRAMGRSVLAGLERFARQRHAVYTLVGLVAVVGLLRSVGGESAAAEQFNSRAVGYCNAPGSRAHQRPVAAEPPAVRSGRLRLTAVTVTVRHGDRSAIHKVPGSVTEPSFDCGNVGAWPQKVRVFSEDTGQPLPSREMTSGKKESGACHAGHLTEAGVRQLAELGAHLRARYEALGAVLNASTVYARSTDYTRTLLSGASFLSSFSDAAVPLRVFEDEDRELMHGVGLRGQSAGSNQMRSGATGEKMLQGGCARAVELAKRELGLFRKPGHLSSTLASLFNPAAADAHATELADALYAGACHGLPLPCGEAGCLPQDAAAAVVRAADKMFCARFTGEHGGAVSTRLAMYPFLAKISDGLQAAADNNTAHTVRLFFGHDTVIAPLLAALGAFDCKWPPLASHVAFELFEDTTLAKSDRFFVRVLFNGNTVQVRGCDDLLCPLGRFRRVVQGTIKPHSTKEEACAARA